MEGVSKGDKIPERPSAEGFSLSSRAKSHCRSTCSVKKPWRAFLRTSYPRSRSANSAKFRFAQLAQSSKSHYRSTYPRPQPKIPERPSAEGFSLSLRVKLHFVQLTRSSKSRSAPLTRGHNLKFRRAKPRGIFPVLTSQVALRATYSRPQTFPSTRPWQRKSSWGRRGMGP